MCYTCILFYLCVNRVLTDGDVIVAVYSILLITCTIGTHKYSRISLNSSREQYKFYATVITWGGLRSNSIF